MKRVCSVVLVATLTTLPILVTTSLAAEKKGKATPSPKAAATPTPTPPPRATPEPAPAPPAPAGGAPMAEGAAVLSPEDIEGLKAKMGMSVTIEGVPVRAGESKSKTVRFLDFANGAGKAITLVFVTGKGEAITLEEVQAYIGKKLRVTGTVSEYSGKLQIPIEQKAQVVEVMP